ncbi:hypothetical protein TTHERM_00497630 (macronuclear) [Tetrahymena thermophila SB210]|uniref:GYF domain protein n=1 Tax=Tetrahymena thermophila (strain SB210) TaxID=312017 RepID=I7LY51_TETTS|nr:hypothetical protein TTHERM_00497630 [Tetrahymena thermophila SB210]EAS07709.1 hypothetical protein TTHERM_00497630 [Tetrahymena thermophila SB210]|eukprot:XP_001027951.1 hypothetical protein TTHERM_00497630 [Tetrahymena thermophila SB210]
MQVKTLQYTKQQLLDSFKKKQNDQIRELIMQETGVDLFTELPQEAVNKQQDQLALDLNQGFFKNKKGFINKNNNNNQNFRGDNNNNKFSNDFKRGPLNNKNQESGDGMRFNRKNQGGQQAQQSLKELIPVFQDCGFIKDSTIEVWYYKESEEIEGPFNSVDMDNMLFANKVNFETKVAFKDPEEKYVRIKKLIQLTYEDKYNHLLEKSKPTNNDENNNQRRYQKKKEFTGSNEENTNFSRGVPRFTKQTSENNNANNSNQQNTAITRPQFTRTISDAKNQNTTETPQVNSKQTEQNEISKPQEPQKNTAEQKKPQESKEEIQATASTTKAKTTKEEQKTPTISQPQKSNEDKLQQNQESLKNNKEEKQAKPSKENKKQTKELKEQKQEPKQEVKAQVETTTAATVPTPAPATSAKQSTLVQLPVQQEQSLEGFQVIPSKQAGKKKFDKKNATKILVTGLSEQEIKEEENRKRLEEIRQRDLIQQQKFAEQQAKAKEQEQALKKLDYFDDESKVEEIIGEEENFPTLGQPNTNQKKNQLVSNNKKQQVKAQNQSDEDEETDKQEQVKQASISKTGNKLVKGGQTQGKNDKKQVANKNQQEFGDDWIVNDKNSKKKQSKRTQEESDEEYERQQAIINEQARQERLKKQKEQEEKQRQLELQQQEEKRKIEEFQRRQQFGDQDYHSESEEEIDPSDEKSFPTLGGQVYNGPPKKNQNQQNKTKGKFNTTAQSKALYSYVKTLEENAWDIQPKKQPIKQQQQQKTKQSHISNDDFPSL